MHELERLGLAIARSAELHSQRPAIIDDDGVITYADLLLRAGGFARAIDEDTDVEDIVAVSMRPGADVYAAILGCVLSGRTFCTLNPIGPEGRRRAALNALRPTLILADDMGTSHSVRTILSTEVSNGSFSPLEPTSEILYVLFTSGSTGIPKGVRIAEAAAMAFLRWALEFYDPSPCDRWAQFNAPTFDLSLIDLFTTVLAGASLVPFHAAADRLRPSKKITRHHVTVWHAVPSTIQLLLEGGRISPDVLRNVRLFSFCGEPLMTHVVRQLKKAIASDARVINTYGPTETTFFFTAHEISQGDLQSANATIPLGDPIPGWDLSLEVRGAIDEALFEVVVNSAYIGRGYIGDDQGGFCGDCDRPTSFYTGDLVRKVGRNIYFHSRVDRQRKLRGVRLELGEVEKAAFECGLGNTYAEIHDGHLVLFVSREEASISETEEIPQLLARHLPAAIVPTSIMVVPEFPRTKSFKVDVKQLIQAYGSRSA